MLWYTGSETELKSENHGIDISHYSKPSKIVLTLAEFHFVQRPVSAFTTRFKGNN
jgi:hypothetical protein